MGSVPAGDSGSSRTTMAKRMAVLSPGRAHLGRRVGGEAWMIGVEEVSLAELRRRTSAKWRAYPSDVLPLAGFTAGRWGWHIDPADVTLAPEVGVGVVEVLRLLVRPGDRVVINPPVYDSFFPWIVEAGCRLVEVPLGQTGNGWALDLDALQAAF